jgi:hypothetical protein
MRYLVIAAVVAALAVVAAAGAQAADGWRVAKRASDTGSYATFVYGIGQGRLARLTLRAAKGNRLELIGSSVNCSSRDYSRTVAHDLPRVTYTARGMGKPIVRLIRPTFAGAARCDFSVTVHGGPGLLRMLLEVRGG